MDETGAHSDPKTRRSRIANQKQQRRDPVAELLLLVRSSSDRRRRSHCCSCRPGSQFVCWAQQAVRNAGCRPAEESSVSCRREPRRVLLPTSASLGVGRAATGMPSESGGAAGWGRSTVAFRRSCQRILGPALAMSENEGVCGCRRDRREARGRVGVGERLPYGQRRRTECRDRVRSQVLAHCGPMLESERRSCFSAATRSGPRRWICSRSSSVKTASARR
jgi:hypothetical protein